MNVVSAAMTARAVHPHLVARGGGAIVNFTSISAKVAQTGRWLYPVGKAALVQLTRNMAMDLATDGIRVNSVSPGWTWSKVMVELTGDDRAKTDAVAAPFHLLGRAGDPEEVANVVVFLCRRRRVVRHRRRLGRRRRLLGAGARAGGAGNPEVGGIWKESDAQDPDRRGGQAGLQLGLGLVQNGYEVTVVSNRTPDDIRDGRVMSSQCMFDTALQHERDLGLDVWEEECPPVEGIALAVPAPGRQRQGDRLRLAARPVRAGRRPAPEVPGLDGEARGEGRHARDRGGGRRGARAATRREHDLVVVAAGKGEITRLFERDAERSPYEQPMRALALTYVTGMTPRPEYSAVCFNLIPTVGEYFVFPALTDRRPCEIMVFEGIPGGPMDCWGGVDDPRAAPRALALDPRDLRAVGGRALPERRARPTRTASWPAASRRPCAKPVGELPCGAPVLGLADAVMLNDPITGQGSNNASKAAAWYPAASSSTATGRSTAASWSGRSRASGADTGST